MSHEEPSRAAQSDAATNNHEMCARAVAYLRSVTDIVPTAAIVLGSGLGDLADKIDDPIRIPFAAIPGFSPSTVGGHCGQLIFGRFAQRTIVAMAGRLHRYEGHSNDDVTFPIEVMAALGATHLIVSNAAGGVNPKLRIGDIIVIRDHINLMGGINRSAASGQLHSLTHRGEIYDREMSTAAMQTAVVDRFNAYEGTYVATLGPNYETRSEYRMMRRIGADVVGMSTVPEVLAAARLGMRILGISMVSNVANPDQAIKANHDEVLEAGKAAAVKMERIVQGALACTG